VSICYVLILSLIAGIIHRTITVRPQIGGLLFLVYCGFVWQLPELQLLMNEIIFANRYGRTAISGEGDKRQSLFVKSVHCDQSPLVNIPPDDGAKDRPKKCSVSIRREDRRGDLNALPGLPRIAGNTKAIDFLLRLKIPQNHGLIGTAQIA